jgi:hypothetical protein
MSVCLLNNLHVWNNLYLFNTFGAFSFQLAIRMSNTRKHMYAHKNPDTYPICFFQEKKSKGEEIF